MGVSLDLTTVLLATVPAAISGVVGYKSAKLGPSGKLAELEEQRNETERSHRQSYYHQFLDALDEVDIRIRLDSLTTSKIENSIMECQARASRIEVIAPEETISHVHRIVDALVELSKDAQRQRQAGGPHSEAHYFSEGWPSVKAIRPYLIEAMRKDVGVV